MTLSGSLIMGLTRERIEIYANAHGDAEIRSMAKQLLAEMDKPKVWEGAHEWQDRARVKHYSNSALCAMDETFKDYTRTLPKSRIDEIAEEAKDLYMATSAGDSDLSDSQE